MGKVEILPTRTVCEAGYGPVSECTIGKKLDNQSVFDVQDTKHRLKSHLFYHASKFTTYIWLI